MIDRFQERFHAAPDHLAGDGIKRGQDRIDARNDYEADVRAEIVIMAPQAKIDATCVQELAPIMSRLNKQAAQLSRLEANLHGRVDA